MAQRCGPSGAALVLQTEAGAKLYLSGEKFASDQAGLHAAGIAAIVTCGCRCHFPESFVYLDIRLTDHASSKVGRHLDPAADFLATRLANGDNVLCHCKAGICRSSTMIVAYLIKYRGLGVDEALSLVRRARSCARPRAEFIAALHAFAERLDLGVAVVP